MTAKAFHYSCLTSSATNVHYDEIPWLTHFEFLLSLVTRWMSQNKTPIGDENTAWKDTASQRASCSWLWCWTQTQCHAGL